MRSNDATEEASLPVDQKRRRRREHAVSSREVAVDIEKDWDGDLLFFDPVGNRRSALLDVDGDNRQAPESGILVQLLDGRG